MSQFDIDTIVIGAGVVGLATAAQLARNGHETILLEKEALFGSGCSSRNSEVIHAGIYYPTNSLKHLCCVEGRRLLYPYLQSHGVAHKKCGKLIVATSDDDVVKLDGILQKAQDNGVEGLIRLSPKEAKALEPALNCTGAILSPETGIMDSHGLMLAYLGDFEDNGGALALNSPVIAVEALQGGGFLIVTGGADATRLTCKNLINSGGLYAQSIASEMTGIDKAHIPPRTLAKGNYFSCTKNNVFERLIYPIPEVGGLGVHITLDLGGQIKFGPDVEWLDFEDPDLIDYKVDPKRSEKFYDAVRKYWPDLPDGSIRPDYSGCRPKNTLREDPAGDFMIHGPQFHNIEGLVNLFGIESPGLTSSMAIANRVAQIIG